MLCAELLVERLQRQRRLQPGPRRHRGAGPAVRCEHRCRMRCVIRPAMSESAPGTGGTGTASPSVTDTAPAMISEAMGAVAGSTGVGTERAAVGARHVAVDRAAAGLASSRAVQHAYPHHSRRGRITRAPMSMRPASVSQ